MDAEVNNNFFSASISSDGSTVLVGAQGDDEGINTDQGSACVYFKPGGGWAGATEDVKLFASECDANDNFGYAVSVSSDGSPMIIGAFKDLNWPGKAYAFE